MDGWIYGWIINGYINNNMIIFFVDNNCYFIFITVM